MEHPAKRPRLDRDDFSLAPLILGDELPELWEHGVIAPVILPPDIEYYSPYELLHDVDWSCVIVHYRLVQTCRVLLARRGPRIAPAIRRIRRLLRRHGDPATVWNVETVMGWPDAQALDLFYALSRAITVPTYQELLDDAPCVAAWRRALVWGNVSAAPSGTWWGDLTSAGMVRSYEIVQERMPDLDDYLVLPSGSVELCNAFLSRVLWAVDLKHLLHDALPILRWWLSRRKDDKGEGYRYWLEDQALAIRMHLRHNTDLRVLPWFDAHYEEHTELVDM